MKLAFDIAFKYFLSIRKKQITSIIAGISMTSILFGTMAMIIVLSIFNGFDDIIQKLYKDIDPDFRIELIEGDFFDVNDKTINAIKNIGGVFSCSEVLEYKMLAKNIRYQQIVDVKGVDLNYRDVTKLKDCIILGNSFDADLNFFLVGRGVFHAFSLKLLDFENPLKMSFFDDNMSGVDLSQSIKTQAFYPTGVFSTQLEIDHTQVLLSIDHLRDFLSFSRVCSALEVAIDDDSHYLSVRNSLKELMGANFKIKNRFEQRPFINKMIRTEKLVVYIIFTFILIVSMLSLISSLVIVLMEKQKDIYVLGALGLGSKSMKNIFLFIGVLITSSGVMFGTFFGILFCLLQARFGFIKISGDATFFIDSYPIQISIIDVLFIQTIILLLGALISYFVSRVRRFYY